MPPIVPVPPRDPWPRPVDVLLASVLLLATMPLLLVLALLIRAVDGSPVLFVQERLGRNRVPFRLHKLRTLRSSAGATVSPWQDPRTTKLGRWLRRSHLDELPQLFDVLRGRMSLVGPRPEVPANLEAIAPQDVAALLTVRPGLTGPTQLAFLAEDELLADVADPVSVYREVLVPAKVAMDLAWLPRRTLRADLLVLLRTPWRMCSEGGLRDSRARLREVLRPRDQRS